MKLEKNVYLLCLVTVFACNNDQITDTFKSYNTVEDVNSPINPKLRSGGDQHYDLLGYGYDATSVFFDGTSDTKGQVVDIQKIVAADPARIIPNAGNSTNYRCYTSASAVNLAQTISLSTTDSAHIDISKPLKFTGEIKQSFGLGQNIAYSTKNSFAYYDFDVIDQSYTINHGVDSLKKYLTTQFLADVQNYPASYIISRYGTHVLGQVVLGGKLKLLYKSFVNSTNIDGSLKAGLAASILKSTINKSIDFSYNASLATNNSSQSVFIKTIGGGFTTFTTGTTSDYSTLPSFNYNTWLASIPTERVLIGCNATYLIPIYELISDPAKKAEITTAFNNAFLGNKIYDLSPLYKYHKTNGHHFYTSDYSELRDGTGTTWNYEDVLCFVPPVGSTYVAPSIPLYRYYKSLTADHYYTTDWTQLQEGSSGYVYEHVQCNLYATQVTGTVPLYRYWSSVKHDHFFTLTKTSYTDYSYECIAGYVFPLDNSQIVL